MHTIGLVDEGRAFDTVSHKIVVKKLTKYRMDEQIVSGLKTD